MSWKVKPLGALCSIQLGKTPARKSSRFWDLDKESDNVWLSISDLIHGQAVGESAEYVSNEALPMMKVVPVGTLLVSFKLTLGRTSIAARDLFTNEAIAAILNLNECLNQRFLMHFFERFDWKKACEGDEKLKGYTFNKTKLNDLEIPIPPLEEQERIVEVLDEAFAAIDKAKANIERNLTNARELFQSRLNDIFSNHSEDWEVRPLGETCDIVGRIGFRGYTRKDLVEEGEGAISMSPSNIQGQKLHFEKCTFLSWDKYHESPEIMVLEGDVVFCKTGSTYGKCAFVDSLPIETTLNPQLVVFKNIKAEAEFIFYACTSPFFQKQIENVVGGTATPTISQKKIGACLVPTPSIQEQRKLVEHLQKVRTHVEKLESDYQTELDNLEELRQSILEQAFEGKLTEPIAA